jgi:parallel beta-helix repeat protein
LAAVALAVPSTAAASVTSVRSCQQITSPGTYRLDADITAPLGPGDCFDIGASGVTLILNGHTITGNGGRTGIDVFSSGVTIVGPGTVSTGFGRGIILAGGDGSVRGVTVNRDGNGIVLISADNSVRGNVTTGNGFGIIAASGATGNTIIGNYAHPSSVDDLFDANANCDSNVWLGNDFETANQTCIH